MRYYTYYILYVLPFYAFQKQSKRKEDTALDEQPYSVLRQKSHLSHADRNKSFTNCEKQRIKLNIFVNFFKKKHFFYTLRQQSFFFISFPSFEGVRYSNYLSFFPSYPMHPTNSCFALLKAILDRDLQNILNPQMNYCFFSTVTYVER